MERVRESADVGRVVGCALGRSQRRRIVTRALAAFDHMTANRLLRSPSRAQELVVYDFLAGHHASMVARRRGEGRRG